MGCRSGVRQFSSMECEFESLEYRTLFSGTSGLAADTLAALAAAPVTATTGPLTLKYITQVGVSTSDILERQFHPVMGDIDNDGTEEIVLTAGDSLYAINGKTGAIEWKVAGSGRERAPELADLNHDGTPEVLYGLTGPRLRAVDGHGNILWTTPKLRGGDQSMFPILTADIDGDGYPTIYFAGQGGISMIDHNGKVQPQWGFVIHPCWGGMAMADANNDGKYELYVGDRSSGYGGMGVACFDAQTLKLIWSRSDIHHSSPIPIIADVNNDGKLEVVAERIVNNGPMVLDAMTGKTIKNYSNMHLPCHGTGTVYDIDGDGHMEIMLGTGYGGHTGVYDVDNEFVVLDLVTGKVDFRPKLDHTAVWPPRVGDVTGDGKMEIIAALGYQWDRVGTSPLMIYDSHYNLIQRLDLNRSGQLSEAKVFDTDGDGLNEVVVVGKSGKVYVFDTPGVTPNPAPNTWVQGYSDRRDNVPVYTAPPGPKKATAMVAAQPVDAAKDTVNLLQAQPKSKAFTIEGLIKPGDRQTNAFDQRKAGAGVLLDYNSSSKQVQLVVGNTRIVAPVATGQLYQIVATYDGTTAALYVNGRQVGSKTASLSWSAYQTLVDDNQDEATDSALKLGQWQFSTIASTSGDVLAAYSATVKAA